MHIHQAIQDDRLRWCVRLKDDGTTWLRHVPTIVQMLSTKGREETHSHVELRKWYGTAILSYFFHACCFNMVTLQENNIGPFTFFVSKMSMRLSFSLNCCTIVWFFKQKCQLPWTAFLASQRLQHPKFDRLKNCSVISIINEAPYWFATNIQQLKWLLITLTWA